MCAPSWSPDPQAAPDGPLVELCIADDGPGIDPEMLGRLFEPYVTTKTKGTGLGLAIVKKIIEEHGGIIRADNGERGACITARLPAMHGTPRPDPPTRPRPRRAKDGPRPSRAPRRPHCGRNPTAH